MMSKAVDNSVFFFADLICSMHRLLSLLSGKKASRKLAIVFRSLNGMREYSFREVPKPPVLTVS